MNRKARRYRFMVEATDMTRAGDMDERKMARKLHGAIEVGLQNLEEPSERWENLRVMSFDRVIRGKPVWLQRMLAALGWTHHRPARPRTHVRRWH